MMDIPDSHHRTASRAPRGHTRTDATTCLDLAHRVFAALHRATSADWLALDLTMGQMKALMTITAYGPQPVGELGRRLGIGEPAASLLADRLEAAGLASRERDPGDRRRALVTPTAAARELATALRAGRDEHVRRWLTALAPDELDALCRGLRGLLRVAEQGEASGDGEPSGHGDAKVRAEACGHGEARSRADAQVGSRDRG